MNKSILPGIIFLLLFNIARSQTSQAPFLKLINKEGVVITQKDTVVSKKFFQSSTVTLQSDETIARGSEIVLMLGVQGIMFDNPMLSPDIKQQIMKQPVNTKIVFSIEQKTAKELKFWLVE